MRIWSTKSCIIACLTLGVFLCASGALGMMCEALFEEAKEAYQAGEYDAAVRKAVSALEFDPSYRPPVPFLHEILPKAYERHLKKLAEFEQANEKDQAAAERQAILELVSLVKNFPHRFPLRDLQGPIANGK